MIRPLQGPNFMNYPAASCGELDPQRLNLIANLLRLISFAVNNDSIHYITPVSFPHHNETFLRNLFLLSRETVAQL